MSLRNDINMVFSPTEEEQQIIDQITEQCSNNFSVQWAIMNLFHENIVERVEKLYCTNKKFNKYIKELAQK